MGDTPGLARGSQHASQALDDLVEAAQRLEASVQKLRGKAAEQTLGELSNLLDSLKIIRSGLERRRPDQVLIVDISDAINRLIGILPGLSAAAASKTRQQLLGLMDLLTRAFRDLDPIKEPASVFDPARPTTAGRLVALALIAQPKVPLGRIVRSYGSGVYAIYYKGPHPAYARISGTETPIYVGKADPKSHEAETPREQGAQLSGRLIEHRRTIRKVEEYALEHDLANPLRVADFECRKLVVATNAQLIAERHLINLFRPLWNDETKICWGMSKHGDSAGTRSNARSPFDVLHPGRAWAMDERLRDSKTMEQILAEIDSQLDLAPPVNDKQEILERFLLEFRQDPGLAEHELSETEDAEGPAS